jgi:hypothetical protein
MDKKSKDLNLRRISDERLYWLKEQIGKSIANTEAAPMKQIITV